MEKSSLVGKRLLIVKLDFKHEHVKFLEENNDCEFIDSLSDAFRYEFNDYDHLFCHYSFEQQEVKELFSKINSIESLSPYFLISPRELTRYAEQECLDIQKIELAQEQINDYINKYPDFFKKVDPNFYKKRLITFNIQECGATTASEMAVFSYDANTIGLISKTKIVSDILNLKLEVNISFGNEKEQILLNLKGKCSQVVFDVEDMDQVYCYDFSIYDKNETYLDIINAQQQQEDFLTKKMAVGGFE